MLMPGYRKRPDHGHWPSANGWLSGDLGYLDKKDGFLYPVDRQKDMIISGGVNVYPRAYRGIIVRHPAVREGGGLWRTRRQVGQRRPWRM